MTTKCHPELSWILFHKKSLLTTLRCRSPDFLFLRVCTIASHYTKSACFRVYIKRYFATLSMTIDISRHSEPTKWVKNLYYSNLAYIYFFWYFWQQKYRKTARLQLRDLFW